MDNNNTINVNQKQYLSPNQLAQFCFDVVVPELSAEHRPLLQKHRDVIQSILIRNKVDSLRAPLIEAANFWKVVQQSTSKATRSPAKYLWNALRAKMKKSFEALNWKHIVNAVRHEMNDAIAQIVDSASSDLNDLEKGSGKALISAIRMEGKRSLTLSEAQYLVSLIERATKKLTLTSNDHSYHMTFCVHFVNLLHSSVAPPDEKRCTDCTDCSIARCSATMRIAATCKYSAFS